MPADTLRLSTLAVLAALAEAEDGDEPPPSLSALANACGLPTNSAARYELLTLSDRRLIDGYGTARRLTEAGWETLEEAGVMP